MDRLVDQKWFVYTSFVVLERLSGWLSIAAFVQWNKRFAIKFTCGSKTNTIYHHLQCFPQITFSRSLRAAYAWARPGMNLKHTTYIYRHSIFAAKTSARSRLCLHRLQPSLCTQSNVSKYMLYVHSDIGMTIHHRTSITLCFECSHIHHYVIASLLANAVLPSFAVLAIHLSHVWIRLNDALGCKQSVPDRWITKRECV